MRSEDFDRLATSLGSDGLTRRAAIKVFLGLQRRDPGLGQLADQLRSAESPGTAAASTFADCDVSQNVLCNTKCEVLDYVCAASCAEGKVSTCLKCRITENADCYAKCQQNACRCTSGTLCVNYGALGAECCDNDEWCAEGTCHPKCPPCFSGTYEPACEYMCKPAQECVSGTCQCKPCPPGFSQDPAHARVPQCVGIGSSVRPEMEISRATLVVRNVARPRRPHVVAARTRQSAACTVTVVVSAGMGARCAVLL